MRAWLETYDKLNSFPKFFYPDPTVKRQSGFLMPQVIDSSSQDSCEIALL